MPRISLKIDVDSDRGTAEGALRLASALERLGVQATFFFSIFRRGLLGSGRRRDAMRSITRSGFEVGVGAYDCVKWRDHVARANEVWTRSEMERAIAAFEEVFERAPLVHGAAGWQVNDFVPELEQQLGFHYASDTRGTHPFFPYVDGVVSLVAQLPTTLPTLDELVGRTDVAAHLDSIIEKSGTDHVFTLRAELASGNDFDWFVSSLERWRSSGHVLGDLSAYRQSISDKDLPVHEIATGDVEGRSGKSAIQGLLVTGPVLQLNPVSHAP